MKWLLLAIALRSLSQEKFFEDREKARLYATFAEDLLALAIGDLEDA